MDAIEDTSVRVVVIKASARIGKTFLVGLTILHSVVVDPTSMVYFGAIDKEVARFRNVDFQEILSAAPRVAGRLPKMGERGNNADYASFHNGGTCYWRSGTKESSYRGYEASVHFIDELDAWEPRGIKNPGSPSYGAAARTTRTLDRRRSYCRRRR